MGVTFDGLSNNRRLLKIHDQSSKCMNKVKNVYATEERYLFLRL